jgi:hypothetical protein
LFTTIRYPSFRKEERMRPPKVIIMFVCLLIILPLGLVGYGASSAAAADAKTLLKEADKALRQAQRDMFSGKNEKAIAALENIRSLLDKAKAEDPNNPGIKTAENKYAKLVKDLERKTGRDLGGGASTARASTPTELPPKPEAKPTAPKPTQAVAEKKSAAPSAKVPFAARHPLDQAKQALRSV